MAVENYPAHSDFKPPLVEKTSLLKLVGSLRTVGKI